MTKQPGAVEKCIQSTESLLGLRIVMYDFGGFFCDSEGESVLAYKRNSHRPNPCCETCRRAELCDAHCKSAVLQKSHDTQTPFTHDCWKGITEVTAPVMYEGYFLGILFAGPMRSRITNPPASISTKARDIIEALPEMEPEKAGKVGQTLLGLGYGLPVMHEQSLQEKVEHDSRKFQIARLIRLKATQGLSLTEVAATLHLSQSRTSHLIQDLFDTSLRDLILEERIKRAKNLLVTTDFSVGEISRRLGLESEYHFNRCFKKMVGIPPGKFRKERIGNIEP